MTAPAIDVAVERRETESPAPDRPPPQLIEPVRGWVPLGLRELADFRELLYFLVWRDLKVRYKQTALGVTWSVLQPVVTALIFTLIFGRLVGVPSEGVPYALFAVAGLLLWILFAQSVTQGSESLVTVSNIVTKVYFPRLLVPLASVVALMVDFLIGLVILIPVLFIWGPGLDAKALLAPAFVLVTLATAAGIAFWLSALNVRYRDFRYITPFLVQLWFFASPVAYPSSLLDGTARVVYAVNPLAGAIDGFRWTLLGTPAPPLVPVLISILTSLVVFVGGLYYFRRLETTIADVM
jgi:lipopolysaccharide transport system permease protein